MVKKPILIVDDEPSIRTLVRKALSDFDCDILEAADGAAVPEMIRKTPPALVVMDIHMPLLDGIAVIDEIRRASRDTGIIILTGDASSRMARLAMERGANEFLAKPLDVQALRDAAQALLLLEES